MPPLVEGDDAVLARQLADGRDPAQVSSAAESVQQDDRRRGRSRTSYVNDEGAPTPREINYSPLRHDVDLGHRHDASHPGAQRGPQHSGAQSHDAADHGSRNLL